MEGTDSKAGRPRFRDAGFSIGTLPAGTRNAITDVPGVAVGHRTIIRGEGALARGIGPVRTGVTVILPHRGDCYLLKVRAAVHSINGYGKAYGFEQVRELGVIESPIALTNTFSVGSVADSIIRWSIDRNPAIGSEAGCGSLNVVVGETNDGYLNDLAGRHVEYEDVAAALSSALESSDRAPVAEGCVGAGTGTTCFGWKGGIGTSSRVVELGGAAYSLGALVQSNYGLSEALTIRGVPVGRTLRPDIHGTAPVPERGSVMIVIATDAPFSDRQLLRLAKRADVGLARTGSFYGHGSGDFVIAFTTANAVPHRAQTLTASVAEFADEERAMSAFFPAVADVVEESVLNSLFAATTMTGRDGRVRYAIPVDRVLDALGGVSASRP